MTIQCGHVRRPILRCGHCDHEPASVSARMGEICERCGLDGYRLVPPELTLAPVMTWLGSQVYFGWRLIYV